MACIYLGATKVFSADMVWKTFHIWGYADEIGELIGFHFNLSQDFLSASREMNRRDCTNDLQKTLWRKVKERMAEAMNNGEGDDLDVLEPFDVVVRTNIIPITLNRRS